MAAETAAARAGERERSGSETRVSQSTSAQPVEAEPSGVPARIADANRNPAGKAPVGTADARPVVRPAVRLPVAPPDNMCRGLRGQWARPNLQVATYAASWRHRIRQNAPFEILQGAKTGPHEDPVVTVAVRSDGSLESITFNRSSGNDRIDDAVRRIVEMLVPYASFSSELEMECDVIEIPSIWSFDRALRLTWRGQ